MSRQSLTNITVLLVCTWIVFMVVKVQGITDEEFVPCQKLLKRISMTVDVYVDPTKLQKCIDLWTEWRKERISHGLLSLPSPKQLKKELKRMLTQQAKQAHGLVQPEQVVPLNLVAGEQQPQSSQVTLDEVTLELEEIALLQVLVYKTKSKDCTDLVDALLVTPNLPFPPRNKITKHHIIVQDCAKVWEKLRDKAADDLNKQTLLVRELGLMKDRLDQIKVELDSRSVKSHKKFVEDQKTLIENCAKLVHNPLNLNDATMQQKLKYKYDLNKCIAKWEYLSNVQDNNKKRGELAKLKTELARVEVLIRGQNQDPSDVEASVQIKAENKKRHSSVIQFAPPVAKRLHVAPQNVLNPLNLLQPKLKNPPSAALGKEPGPSGKQIMEAGPSHENPVVRRPQEAPPGQQNRIHWLLPKPNNPPSAASGKKPGPSGGSNRNIEIPHRHRSKHSKKVRNRVAKSKPK